MKRKDLFKTILFAIVVLTISFLVAGCTKYDHPIAGNTFVNSVGGHNNYVYYYVLFSERGDFMETTVSRYNYHDVTTSEDHLKWETDGNNITIRYDKSSNWEPSERGKIYKTGFYDPEENTVTLGTSPSTYMTYEYMCK